MWGAASRQPKVEDFAGNGPTTLADVTDVKNCLEYFQLVINDELLNQVVEETNRYEHCQHIQELISGTRAETISWSNSYYSIAR